MSNVLTIPNSGMISFDSLTFPSTTVQPLSTAPRLSFDNAGGIKIQSYVPGTTASDRFSVDGTQGRLFTVSDVLTGVIFSVNDISGLPIVEVYDTDAVIAGEYNTNTFIISGRYVSIGMPVSTTAKVSISGTLALNSNSFRVTTPKTPASSSDTGTTGDICWDNSFLYVCISANGWRRSGLANW